MILSYSRRFIFIHIPKAAGESIKTALKDYRHFEFDHPQKIYPHVKALEIKQHEVGEEFDRFIKFAFIRNPWDRQVSYYHYMMDRPFLEFHHIIKKFKSFGDYIHHLGTQDHLPLPQDDLGAYKPYYNPQPSTGPQVDFLVDNDGNYIVDFIGRVENMQSDFRLVCAILEIDVEATKNNTSKHKDYKSYYNDETKEIIRKAFRRDFEYFDYSFDNSKIPEVYRSTYWEMLENGWNAYVQGKWDTAEKYFLQALPRDPDNFVLLERLGAIYMNAKRYSEALERFMDVLRVKPDSVDAWCGIARIAKIFDNTKLLNDSIQQLLILAPQHSILTELSIS